jgi:hypothetical protein
MPHPTTTEFLTTLSRHESMPQPLGEWVLNELDCGLGNVLNRLALAAALEGCCGIPNVHRATKQVPASAALVLAREALAGLHHWWATDKRDRLLQLAKEAALEGQTVRLLQCWCHWRQVERANRKQDASISLAA